MLPPVDLHPPFNITRASHVRLAVADLAESRRFYTHALGLVVTEEDASTCYLRGLAEACHHSLVLEQARDDVAAGQSSRLGFRVFFEEDLDAAYRFFRERELPATWVDAPHQGRTLHVSDPAGTPLELCATMATAERLFLAVERLRGARAQQYDHVQVLVPDVAELCAFYGELGFRASEYIAHGRDLLASFMYRKGTCLDLAIMTGDGPRLHHLAYVVPTTSEIFTACDVVGELGYGTGVERGPGRHGPGGMYFVYLRDPDGHRVEAFMNHYQTIDLETEPVRWEGAEMSTNVRWGLPGPERWYFEATPFTGVPVKALDTPMTPMTLERYLQQQAHQR